MLPRLLTIPLVTHPCYHWRLLGLLLGMLLPLFFCTIASGPNAGVGRDNPLKSGFITGFTLTEQERRDLIAFLEALTDERFLHDPRYADPFGNER